MKDVFDLLSEGTIMEENDYRYLSESIIIDTISNRLSNLSEGAIKRLAVKTVLNKNRQDKMLSGKSIGGSNVKYDIGDIKREIDCVEHYLKNPKDLDPEDMLNLKAYLKKLKTRYSQLGAGKGMKKYNDKKLKDTTRDMAKFAIANLM